MPAKGDKITASGVSDRRVALIVGFASLRTEVGLFLADCFTPRGSQNHEVPFIQVLLASSVGEFLAPPIVRGQSGLREFGELDFTRSNGAGGFNGIERINRDAHLHSGKWDYVLKIEFFFGACRSPDETVKFAAEEVATETLDDQIIRDELVFVVRETTGEQIFKTGRAEPDILVIFCTTIETKGGKIPPVQHLIVVGRNGEAKVFPSVVFRRRTSGRGHIMGLESPALRAKDGGITIRFEVEKKAALGLDKIVRASTQAKHASGRTLPEHLAVKSSGP